MRGHISSIIVLLFAVLTANAETLVVGSGERYTNISSAVAAAAEGDSIRVLPGEYTENIRIDKRLTLEGVDRPLIRGPGTGSVITVLAEGCTIRGFRIERSGGDLQAEDAGVLLRTYGNIVEDNELNDVLFGIYLYHSGENLIRGNQIVGRRELESGERGAGLHLWNSPDNRLENNVISFTRDGMYIQNSPNNTIRGNRVSDLRYGLHYMSSDDNTFEDNVFYDNVAGAAIMYSARITLRRNAFVHNRGFSSFGILFQDCRNCLTEENLILNNATGLFLEASQDSEFRRNTIAENDTALQIFSSSLNNRFVENNFVDNLSPLSLIGRSAAIEWSTADGGNFWSDYDGYDMDADGTGDVPHKIQNIFEYLEGNFPRLRIYLNSPAAQSIVLAERSFPILRGSNQNDKRPLMRPVNTGISFEFGTSRGAGAWVLPIVSLMMLAVSVITFTRGLSR